MQGNFLPVVVTLGFPLPCQGCEPYLERQVDAGRAVLPCEGTKADGCWNPGALLHNSDCNAEALP